MGEVKHTTGGWARNIKPATKYNCIYAGRNTPVAYLATDLPHDEVEANCSLIAAAPDMLAALQMAVPALEWCQKQWASSPQQGSGINVLDVVRAVIAAAEGH